MLPFNGEYKNRNTAAKGAAGDVVFVNRIARCRGMKQVLMDIIDDNPMYLENMQARSGFFHEAQRQIPEAGRHDGSPTPTPFENTQPPRGGDNNLRWSDVMNRSTKLRAALWTISIGIACCLSEHAAFAQIVNAFPTAEGFGVGAVGGRGGSVYHVTNLNDSGNGSLRNGIDSATGPTTVVFDVGGTIQLQSELWINKSNLTLAGQTAPGGGIAVVGSTTHVDGNVSDVIIRYMRFRDGGASSGMDSLSVANATRVVVDHVSASWGTDESLSVTRSNNVTVQNSIIAETLNKYSHAYGSLVRGNVDAANPGGYTFSHNLWISNDKRNPGIGSYQETDENAKLECDLVNNVIYNWGSRSIHTVQSRDDMHVNLVNNMFIAGPSTQSPSEVMRVENDQSALFGYPGNLYVFQAGNQIDSNKDAVHDPGEVTSSAFTDGFFSRVHFTDRFDFPTLQTQDAQTAYETALARAGASLHRDSVDDRIIRDVMNRTGSIINSQNDVGGYPILLGGMAPLDTDRDGMPDAWELSLGLNPSNAIDGNGIASNGYTNLENYLNTLTGEVTVPERSGTAIRMCSPLTESERRATEVAEKQE